MKFLALSGVSFLAFLFVYESGHFTASAVLGGVSLVSLCLSIFLGKKKKAQAR